MKAHLLCAQLICAVALATTQLTPNQGLCAGENLPPTVAIVRPPPPSALDGVGMLMKIKLEASDPDGTIKRVELFAETPLWTNLVGVVTNNPPYNVLWFVPYDEPVGGPWQLKAVATDNAGATTVSSPVSIRSRCILCPPIGFVEIIAPREGEILSAATSFVVSAEVLVSLGDAGPLEFYIDGESVGIAGESVPLRPDTPPTSITVSNLAEGEHTLSVESRGQNGGYSLPHRIRVVKLGVRQPGINAFGNLEFEVVTSLTNKPNVIQTSSNLQDWSPISTNHPSSNTFNFAESFPATNSHRFYRVVVPPEQQ